MITESKNNDNRTVDRKVIIVFGPTAVGKTELLTEQFHTGFEVVNADSMQVYRGLDIGTAKPGPEIVRKLPHHLIDIKDPKEQYTVGEFVRRADEAVELVSRRNKSAVVSGGTAFYIRNYLFGLPKSPPVDEEVRVAVKEELNEKGPELLYKELEKNDPVTAERIGKNDVYRITRALEVLRATGTPLSRFSVPEKIRKGLVPLIIGLTRERSELYKRIDRRVDMMFEKGLVEEVKRLIAAGYAETDPGMTGIGYREFFLMKKSGCLTVADVRERIKRDTRRFAKRQLTFFRKLPHVHWFYPDQFISVGTLVNRFLDNETTTGNI